MKIKKDINWTQVQDSYFLTHISGTKRYFHEINRTGSFIWDALKNGNTIAEISEQVSNEFNVQLETAAADVSEFCLELVELDLLEDE